MKKLKKMSKKQLIAIAVALLFVIVIACLIVSYINKTDSMNDLKITYNNGKTMKFSNFKKDFTEEKKITVENKGKENKVYSLEWEGIENNLNKQNTFTYEITCEGDRCATLGTSQVPVAGFKLFPQVLIEPGKKQVYTIKFKYSGSEKGKDFKGRLMVYSEKVKEFQPEPEKNKTEKTTKTVENKKA